MLEVLFRRLSVGNRGMPPLHVPVSNRPREIVHLQIGELLVGDQADHRSRSPVLNRVEVGVEIPLPGPFEQAAPNLGLLDRQRAPAKGGVVPVPALERAVDEESQHAGRVLFRGFSGFHSGVVLLFMKGDLTPRLVPRCISVIRC